MRDDDAELMPLDRKLSVKRVPRLIAAHAQIDVAHGLDRETRQQRIGKAGAVIAILAPGHGEKTGRFGKMRTLIELPVVARAEIDLLQADDVGAELAQHGGDAVRIIAPIDADTAMNVVSGDHEPASTGSSPRGATPATDHRLTSKLAIAGWESLVAMLLHLPA